MKFRFTGEQELLRRTARQFAERTFTRERVRELDEAGTAPHREWLPAMAALGFTALPIPVAHGGLGGTAIESAILMEELGRASLVAAQVLDGAVGAGCELVKRIPEPSRRQALFDRQMAGDLAMTLLGDGEAFPARLDGTSVVLDDLTALVTGAHVVDRLIVPVSIGGAIDVLLLAPDAAGCSYHPLDTIGMRAGGGLFEASLRSVRADRNDLLGATGPALDTALDRSRLHLAAACVGCSQQMIDEAVRYAQQREQFGQAIGKFQGISHLLVDLQVDVDAARALVCEAAWLDAMSRASTQAVAMARLASTEAMQRTASDTMRVFGGYGLTMEFDVQRHFRDARHFLVDGGFREGERARIARAMGLP